MGEGETEVDGYLDAADTRSTLDALARSGRRRALGARGPRQPAGRIEVGSAALARCRRRPRARRAIDVGNAGTLLRMLPGWLAGPAGGVDARRRRVDPPPPGRPRRRAAAADGRRRRVPRRAPAAAAGPARAAARDRLPAAGRQRAGEVVRAARRPLAEGETSVTEPARRGITPSGCCARRGAVRVREPSTRRSPAAARAPHHRRAGRPPRGRADPRPRRLLLGGLPRRRRGDRAAAARCGSTASASTRPASGCWGSSTGWAPRSRSRRGRTRRREPRGTIVARHGPLTATTRPRPTRCRSRSTSCPWSRSSAASPRARRSVSGAEELRHKESDRIATVVDGLRGSGAEIEATDDGFVVDGTGGLGRGARLARRPPPGDARRGRRARLARRRRGGGWTRRRSAIPRFEADLASLAATG